VRYTANDIGLGVSAEYTRFSETPDVDVTLFGVFLQPSVYVTTASHSTTLLGLRIGRVQKTVGVGGESFTAGGWALGATAGVQMWLTRTVGVEGGLVYDRMWYGDAATGGSVLPGSATGGWSLGMNVAFVFQVLRLAR
jgi:hypothetical protein